MKKCVTQGPQHPQGPQLQLHPLETRIPGTHAPSSQNSFLCPEPPSTTLPSSPFSCPSHFPSWSPGHCIQPAPCNPPWISPLALLCS